MDFPPSPTSCERRSETVTSEHSQRRFRGRNCGCRRRSTSETACNDSVGSMRGRQRNGSLLASSTLGTCGDFPGVCSTRDVAAVRCTVQRRQSGSPQSAISTTERSSTYVKSMMATAPDTGRRQGTRPPSRCLSVLVVTTRSEECRRNIVPAKGVYRQRVGRCGDGLAHTHIIAGGTTVVQHAGAVEHHEGGPACRRAPRRWAGSAPRRPCERIGRCRRCHPPQRASSRRRACPVRCSGLRPWAPPLPRSRPWGGAALW